MIPATILEVIICHTAEKRRSFPGSLVRTRDQNRDLGHVGISAIRAKVADTDFVTYDCVSSPKAESVSLVES